MADDWEALLGDDSAISFASDKDKFKEEVDMAFVKPVVTAAPAPKVAPKPAAPKKKKALGPSPTTPSHPETAEEKAQRIEAEKRADYDSARDLFDDVDNRDFSSSSTPTLGEGITIDTFKPTNEKEFEEFATYLSARITPHESHYNYRGFLKSLIKQITDPITAEDLKEINQFLSILVNEKIKKVKAKPKKGAVGKKTLNMSKAADNTEEEGDAYDDLDDFM